MANLSGQNVCDEVAFRISNRLAANGSGAGSLINFTNDCLGLITASASWVWDQTSAINIASSSLAFLVNIDVGKKISLFNTSSKTPIVKVSQDEYLSSSAGYINTGTDWNSFRTQWDSFGSVGLVELFPLGGAGSVDIYYSMIPPVLVYGATPTVRWNSTEMDDLLKDWTTAKAMKWLGMAGWDVTWADCLGRLAEMRRMYTTERIDMGPEDEAKSAVAEKQLGRA